MILLLSHMSSAELFHVVHETTRIGHPEREELQVSMVTMGYLMQRVDDTLHKLSSLFLVIHMVRISVVCGGWRVWRV